VEKTMNPDPEKDVLGENLRRALGACDDQVERSHAEFLRRLGPPLAAPGLPATRRPPGVGLVTLAASLFVCASIFVAILSRGGPGPAPAEGPAGTPLQDPPGPQGSEEESLLAQIALQERVLEWTRDPEERALVGATIKTLRSELARVQDGGASRAGKKGGPDPLDELTSRLKARPDDVDLRLLLAEAKLKRKMWTEALADGKKAVEIAPERAKAHLMVGRACLLLKQPEEADKAFARALELDPKLASAIQEVRTPPPPKGKADPAEDRAARLRADLEAVELKLKTVKDPDLQASLEMRRKEIARELQLLEAGSRKDVPPKDIDPPKEPPKKRDPGEPKKP
jgi:hypothetical protein